MSLGATYLRIVASRWRLIAALIAACTLGAWAVSVFYLAHKPKFEAAARLNIVPTSEELGYASRFVRGSTFDGGSVLLGTYAEFAHTRPVVEPIVDRYIAEQAAAAGTSVARWTAANTAAPGFSPGRILAILNYGEAPVVPLREELVEAVVKGTTIENVEGTYLVRLSVEWDDPRSAAWMANALADAIIARAERASRSTGQELAGTLEARLDQKKAELAAALKQSRDLKSGIGVVDIDRQKESLLAARLTEQAQLTTDRAALDSSQSQVAALQRQAGGKLSGAQATLEQTLAVEAPRASGLARSVAVREGRIAQLDRQIASLGGSEDRVKALDDRAAALQAEVAALTERVSFSRTENLVNGPRIQLIERASPPPTRSSPKVFFNTLLGFVAGCALAACALLLLGEGKPRPRVIEEEESVKAPEPAAAARPSGQVLPIRPDPPLVAAAATEPRPIAGNAALALDTAPEPEPEADLAPFRLPRPADGSRYTPAEIVDQMPALVAWLGAPLSPDARGLFVAATGGDADAQHLSQLLHGVLRRLGSELRIVDGTKRAARWDGAGKPFVYLGGMIGSARPELLARLTGDAQLVLATDDADDWRARLGEIPVRSVHVVAFER